MAEEVEAARKEDGGGGVVRSARDCSALWPAASGFSWGLGPAASSFSWGSRRAAGVHGGAESIRDQRLDSATW